MQQSENISETILGINALGNSFQFLMENFVRWRHHESMIPKNPAVSS